MFLWGHVGGRAGLWIGVLRYTNFCAKKFTLVFYYKSRFIRFSRLLKLSTPYASVAILQVQSISDLFTTLALKFCGCDFF